VHPALKRFIENGEHELATITDSAERAAAAERLHAEMVRKFLPEEPSATMVPVGDVAERTVEDVLEDIEEAKEDTECRLLEKFNDSDVNEPEVWDGDREPRTRRQKTNVPKATDVEIRSWDGRLREKSITELPKATIERAPVLEPGLVATPDPIEQVDLGDYFEEHHADYQPTRPYHDRVARWMGRISAKAYDRKWKAECGKGADEVPRCERCGDPIIGKRKGTRYCSANCIKRAHEENTIVTR
jgi:hypothetical protein